MELKNGTIQTLVVNLLQKLKKILFIDNILSD